MIRPIQIKVVMNGYIVMVGCQALVFQSRAELLRELDAYLSEPEKTEQRFNEISKGFNQYADGIPEQVQATERTTCVPGDLQAEYARTHPQPSAASSAYGCSSAG